MRMLFAAGKIAFCNRKVCGEPERGTHRMNQSDITTTLLEAGYRPRASYDSRTVTAVSTRATVVAARHDDGSWGMVVFGNGTPGVEVDGLWSALQVQQALAAQAVTPLAVVA